MSAYQGRSYTDEVIELSLYERTPWLDTVVRHESDEEVVEAASVALSQVSILICVLYRICEKVCCLVRIHAYYCLLYLSYYLLL